eukprot:Blabericola_migrator_1__5781@NODE_292_length_10275_cov_168_705525_g240_i0_p8_GENE_NODE_292_length_10275_cov_168_705525_g240_i0NODE_292_length_10275_cov_168_705525_g240_i0_p8_ORF_typecomplete_len138_score14_18Thioredoxin/PF00085_20/1_3e12AhpCTSA/PF00578_21/0_00064Thioredoxin_8/PF13905_6/0_00097Thioredoxin_7/PF13899_6/0_0015Thioredoxin_7/PF13899_6/7_4e03ERp29_N/PF07912_13/0_0065Thioredoxin_2/PF13098_6/0_0091Redoxin/PF08534_10/0_011TraF/PF13728_6/0_024Thioredoxin_4/PF13462_6/0_094Thioredoxin_4/PF13
MTQVLELTPQNRDALLIGPNRPKLILLEVYAPWCPHCRAFVSDYERLAQDIEAQYQGEVVVARYDGAHFPIPHYIDAEYFPSFFLFGKALDRPLSYEGSRSVSGLKAFVQDVVLLITDHRRHPRPTQGKIHTQDYVY